MDSEQRITIRMAAAQDGGAIERLAELEGARPLRGGILVAEVDGELWAAAELGSGVVVADPFRPSGDLAAFLLTRLERLNGVGRWRRGLRRWLGPCGPAPASTLTRT
jgi:hypothetical protein